MSEDQNRTLIDKFMLRLPDGMRGRVKAAAEANNRSMNAEIVATLEEKYPAPVIEYDPERVAELLQRMQAALDSYSEPGASEEDMRQRMAEFAALRDEVRQYLPRKQGETRE